MNYPLIAWRTIHFAATIQCAGVAIFYAVIANSFILGTSVERKLKGIFWFSLAVMIVSGAGWLLAIAVDIDGKSWLKAVTDGTFVSLIVNTQIGTAWQVRLAASALLVLLMTIPNQASSLNKFGIFLFSMTLVAGLAFAGHAAGRPGPRGEIHLLSDVTHLVAAAAWLGGLVPYGSVLAFSDTRPQAERIAILTSMTQRFSNMGILAVLSIFMTGIINATTLLGSSKAFASDYGCLLAIKFGLFLAMLTIAIFNRVVLTPRLASTTIVGALRRNAIVEAALGMAILIIVAILGTMPPPAM